LKYSSIEEIFKYWCWGLKQTKLNKICYGFLSALANPTRLAIIELLKENPLNSSGIADALGLDRTMISHNLKQLVRCNFVSVKREGKQRIYSLNKTTIEPLFQTIENHAKNICAERGNCPVLQRQREEV